MITHEMGDAKPPAARNALLIEWTSYLPGEEPKEKTAVLPRGWEVRAGLRDAYWVAHKMHTECIALFRANELPLPSRFIMGTRGEVVGGGVYTSAEPHDRALCDCSIREAEWELRGQNVPLLGIGVDMSAIPDDQLIELCHRTGAVLGIGEGR